MLYNPKWGDKDVTPTTKGLIAWLETKDPNEHYDYSDPERCACAQYLQYMGSRKRNTYFQDIAGIFGPYAALKFSGSQGTFGQLLSDLKDIQ